MERFTHSDLPSEQVKEVAKNLKRLFNLPYVKETLEKSGVSVQIQYPVDLERSNRLAEHPTSVDVFFLDKQHQSVTPIDIPLFGFPHCVGVVVDDKENFSFREQYVHTEAHSINLNNGNDVAYLTPEDVTNWLDFFRNIGNVKNREGLGANIFELSGLTRVSEKYFEYTKRSFQTIIEQNLEYLIGKGVGNIYHDENGRFIIENQKKLKYEEAYLDIPFLTEDKRRVVLVPLYHIRQAEPKQSMLLETIESEAVLVPGFMIAQPGEHKRDVYERAQKTQEYYQRKFAARGTVVVPVVSRGQIRLWRKLGFQDILRSNIRVDHSSVQLEAEDLVRFLYLGEDNMRQADLSRLGYSLPGNIDLLKGTNREFHGIDLVFFKRDQFGASRITPIETPILGYDPASYKKGLLKVRPVENVVAMSCLPDGLSNLEYDFYTKGPQEYVKKHISSEGNILFVTPTLFEEWQKRGSALSDVTVSIRPPKNTHILYQNNHIQGESQFYYTRFQHAAAVGGAKNAVVEVRGNTVIFNITDFGTEFDLGEEVYKDITAKPTTVLAMRPGLESGKYPMIPGIYDIDYLITTAQTNIRIKHDIPSDPVISYLRSELIHRLTENDIYNFFPKPTAEAILKYGVKDVARWYNGREFVLQSILTSHAHADHNGDKPMLSRDGVEIIHFETYALERAQDQFASTWREKQTVLSKINYPKQGSSYLTVNRPYLIYQWDGEPIALGTRLLYEPYTVSHSVHSVMQKFSTIGMNPDQGLIITNDVRFDESGQTEESVNRLAGRANTIVMETTNGPFSEKPGAGKLESDVTKSLRDTFIENKNSVILVATAKNNSPRIASIIEAAHAVGRKVAFDHKHALINEERSNARALVDPDADGKNIPVFSFGTDVTLWMQTQTQYKPYQRALYNMAERSGMGVVDEDRLSEEGSEWVIVVSPSQLLSFLVGNVVAKNLIYVYSSYYPYQLHDKQIVTANYNWVRERYGSKSYYADHEVQRGGNIPLISPITRNDSRLFHVSGHATSKEMIDKVAIPLLDGKYRNKELAFVHGAEPDVYKRSFLRRIAPQDIMEQDLQETEQFIKRRLGLDHPNDLRIHTHLARYNPKHPIPKDPTDPIGITGFKLRLDR